MNKLENDLRKLLQQRKGTKSAGSSAKRGRTGNSIDGVSSSAG